MPYSPLLWGIVISHSDPQRSLTKARSWTHLNTLNFTAKFFCSTISSLSPADLKRLWLHGTFIKCCCGLPPLLLPWHYPVSICTVSWMLTPKTGWLSAGPINALTGFSRADTWMGRNTAAVHTCFGARWHGNDMEMHLELLQITSRALHVQPAVSVPVTARPLQCTATHSHQELNTSGLRAARLIKTATQKSISSMNPKCN